MENSHEQYMFFFSPPFLFLFLLLILEHFSVKDVFDGSFAFLNKNIISEKVISNESSMNQFS